MTESTDAYDDYDDDPTAEYPEVDSLGVRILDAHRNDPTTPAYIVFDDVDLADIEAAYGSLVANGLVEYTNELVEVRGVKRTKMMITGEAL